jgi:hypothetical protein
MWQRILGPFREFGIGWGALYAADRVLRGLSSRCGLYVYEFIAQPIGSKPLLPASLGKNVRFGEIGRDHPDLALMPARPEIKTSRFEQGAICIGTYRHDKLLGYVWFCFNAYNEDEVRCTYALAEAEHCVFDFDLYVFPESRMGLGFAAVWHAANDYLKSRNIRYTFSRMTRFNLASRRSHARLGGEKVGSAIFLQAWRVELMLATLRPYVYLSWRSGQGPRLWLSPRRQR